MQSTHIDGLIIDFGIWLSLCKFLRLNVNSIAECNLAAMGDEQGITFATNDTR